LLSAEDYDRCRDTIAVLSDAELRTLTRRVEPPSRPATTSTLTSSPT